MAYTGAGVNLLVARSFRLFGPEDRRAGHVDQFVRVPVFSRLRMSKSFMKYSSSTLPHLGKRSSRSRRVNAGFSKSDETKGRNRVRRAAGKPEGQGEAGVIAKIAKDAPTPMTTRHATTLRKRESAAAPPMMKTRSAVADYMGETRQVIARFENVVASDMLSDMSAPNPLLRAYPETTTKGKYLAGIDSVAARLSEARKLQASASFSTALAQFGISPEFDNFDMARCDGATSHPAAPEQCLRVREPDEI